MILYLFMCLFFTLLYIYIYIYLYVVDDLMYLDSELYRNILFLMSYQGNVEELGLTFTVSSNGTLQI
jgi:hypothetical protein